MPKEERATVSVALVVKDEEVYLKDCLLSIRDVADEIVCLVDDSTKDKTFDIANRFADIVEYFKWENDFAKARNLSMSKCTSEWIMIMDGHEQFHPLSKRILLELMRRVKIPIGQPESLANTLFFSGYAYMLKTFPRNEEELKNVIPEIFFLQPRLYRASEFGFGQREYEKEIKDDSTSEGKKIVKEPYNELHYEGRSHNYIIGGDPRLSKYPVKELVFLHARTEENADIRKKQRKKMNVENLKEDIKKQPDKPRPYFYLAQTYLDLGDKENAKVYYEKYINLDTSQWTDERAQAMLALATLEADAKNYKEAETWALQALQERWDRAELYLVLGDISFDQLKDQTLLPYQRENLVKKALHWYKCSAEMPPPMSSLFLHGGAYTYVPHERMAKVYDYIKNWEKAIEHGLKTLKFKPDYQLMIKNIQIWRTNLKIDATKQNVLFLCRPGGETFIKPISKMLETDYNVRTAARYDQDMVKFCNRKGDIVFFEWCDVNLIEATNLPKPENQTWIVRLHCYESYTNQPKMVDWSKVDYIIYVADHIKRKCEQRFPAMKIVPNSVIVNGVDIHQYAFALREHGSNFGFVGIFSWKKGIQQLVQTMRWLLKHYPNFTMHARVDFFEGDATVKQAADYWDYCFESDPELRKHLKYYPKREANLNSWFEDIDYVISCSTIEAFSYYIAEGMLKGIKPLIFDWPGAREVWPEKYVWKDFDDLKTILEGEYNSREYRDYIVEQFSREKQLKAFKKLFGSFKGEK